MNAAGRKKAEVAPPLFKRDARRKRIGVFALGRPHAHRRITLQQLNAVEPLLRGVLQIFDLNVFIEIDEVLS